jgi:hypothetical protein
LRDAKNFGGPGAVILRQRVRQVIENLVELVGIEPTTSSLRTMQSAVLI